MTKALAIAPYATWMALMCLLPSGTAWAYSGRTVAVAAVFLFCIWRARAFGDFRFPRRSEVLSGVAIGLLVLFLWVCPESSEWYRKYCIIGYKAADAAQPSIYDPSRCGWGLTVLRLAGSAFVIAPAEELFFRHFLYRWLQKKDWNSVDHRNFDISAFVWSVGLFALEHDRIVAAVSAGMLYTLLYIDKGLMSAVIAHVTTNLVLGLYVIHTSNWSFW